jgi:hypothetical protein
VLDATLGPQLIRQGVRPSSGTFTMALPENTITPARRDEIRQHVLHEWRMVRCTTQTLIDFQFGDMELNRCLYEAVLDSLLVHARSLHDFFKGPVKFQTDVKAQQLLAPHLSDWEPSGLDAISSTIRDINKFLGHLSWDRLDRDAAWPVTGILTELDSAFDQFVAQLPVDEQASWRA